jgi:subtilisin family serine protease
MRYVLANRRATKFTTFEKLWARAGVDSDFTNMFASNVDLQGVRNHEDPTARQVYVFDADEAEMKAKWGALGPDTILEPEIVHLPLPVAVDDHPSRAVAATTSAQPSLLGIARITVVGGGVPLAGARCRVTLRSWWSPTPMTIEDVTDTSGHAVFSWGPFWSPQQMVVIPAADFWPIVVPAVLDQMVIDVPRLPNTGPAAWWHQAVGAPPSSQVPLAGTHVRVGVADTGFGPHPALGHGRSIGAFIDGTFDPSAAAGHDVDSHGTHVAGTIGGRPVEPSRPAGVAPGVDLYAARVFRSASAGANQADIANAIDGLSRDFLVDILNLSLGSPTASVILQDAIRDATERGTLVLCAAGNSGGGVQYPAKFDDAVAVASLGRQGWGPPNSLSAGRRPSQADRLGTDSLYLANFSCFGDEIDVCAPGVGIIAPVPARLGGSPYQAYDGTSMASPVACGALAALLSATPEYFALPRDITRSRAARNLLASHARSIGLAPRYQGAGVARSQ